MRSTPKLLLFAIAAASWLAAGPGGETTRALLACRHHLTHARGGHHAMPSPDGPCFCGHMTSGLDLAVSTAVPAPPAASVLVVTLERTVLDRSLFPLPPSPAVSPVSPPPNRLG